MTFPLFLVAAVALLAGWLPLAATTVRRRPLGGLVALELAGVLTTLVLVCLAVGLHGSSFAPVALVGALTTIVGGLVFARFLGHQP